MAGQRVFLGFEQPAVRRTSELLVERSARDGQVQLTGVTVVVPGSRAGRRLREHLLTVCGERDLGLLPPQIVTVSHLPELLYTPKRPFASVPLQQIMWGKALRQLDPQLRRQILPGADDEAAAGWSATQWIEYGSVLWAEYRHLSAEGLSFADVCELGLTLDEFPEAGRWQALATLQGAYLNRLDRLQLWDQQTARLVAVRQQECHTDRDLFLLGTSDLGKTLRDMLAQVSDRVTPLVHAPESWFERFDELGCLDVDRWCEQTIDLADQQWSVAQQPSGQAEELARQLSKLTSDVRRDEVRIGCADEQLVPYVRRVLAEHEIPCRWGPGRALETSGPFQLLLCLRDWLREDRFGHLVWLARHPQVNTWLNGRGVHPGWLRRLDQFQAEHLPAAATAAPPSSKDFQPLREALRALQGLRAALSGPPRPLPRWTAPLLETLGAIYGVRPSLSNDVDSRFDYLVCEKIQAAIIEVTTVPDEVVRLDVAEVLELVIKRLSGDSVAPEAEADAVELLGWLELPLDDAPHLFVCGLNEGRVPRSITSDEFLPNQIRTRLKIDDDRRRYARDAYALSVLLQAKQTIHLVMARCDADGNPLKPSRLLFATRPAEVAKRWQKVLAADAAEAAVQLPGIEDRPFGFRVPPAAPIERAEDEIKRIGVTSFKTFLECPYRFYLQHGVRLKAVDQDAQEMNAAVFGTVVHDVLAMFGHSEYRTSSDAEAIKRTLDQQLDECVKIKFGTQPLASVLVQIEQLRQRLAFFATVQAKLVADGWQIAHAEQPSWQRESTASVRWTVGGTEVDIVGHIDRVDYHADLEKYRVLDYKTFETKKEPEKTHRRGGEWIDLQLPLYRHLAGQYGVEGEPELGYFIIAGKQEITGLSLADWDQATLESADAKAEEVIARVLAGDFGEPVDPGPKNDNWKYICLADLPRS